jgi:hypothetical protein
MANLPNFGPAPPPVQPTGDSFSDPLWQRWFASIGSGLPALMKLIFTNQGGSIQGDVNVSGTLTATSVAQTSDERLKHRWRRLGPNFLGNLASLKQANRSGSFSWRTGGRAAGVSAQAVERFAPLLVHEGSDGLKRVDYGILAALSAVELADRAIRADAEVKHLKQELEELKLQVERLLVHEGLR